MAGNSAYWRRRSELLEAATHEQAGKLTAEIERQFNLAQKAVDEQIEQWYGRFAANNGITLAEARQWLAGKDLAEFKWDVNEYIRHGKDAALNPAYIKQLENASARFHISKLDALKLKIQNTAESLYGQTGQRLTGAFGQIYKDNYYHMVYELQKGANIGWDIAAINQKQVEGVLSKPWTLDKRTFSDRLWTRKQEFIDTLHTQLTQNVILGKPPGDAIKAIAEKFGASKSNAARLVNTESGYFAVKAQHDAFEALDVEEYEVVETLDSLTCPVCGEWDGKHLPMSQFEAGVTAPLYHANCRGCTCPYFADEADYGAQRIARAADGKQYYVPSDMKYSEWKDKFVDGGDKSGLKSAAKSGKVNMSVKPDAGALMEVDMNPAGSVPTATKTETLANSQYEAYKADIHSKIGTEYPLTLNKVHQDRHIEGTKTFDPVRSTLTADPVELIELYAGKSNPVDSNSGKWVQKERFTHTEEIGIWRDIDAGVESRTKNGVIHYSKRGAHVVPGKPNGRRTG
jgi:SPP1 gp7 family putative phage head morphogenesis protein